MKTRIATVTIAAAILGVALPSFADRPNRSERLLSEARTELAALQYVAEDVRDRALRSQLTARIDRIDHLIQRADFAMDGTYGLTVEEARSIVANEAFDSGKVESIQRIARQGRFSTAEARSLAAMCSFDSARADALIALYPSVNDPWRFQLALDILDFSSTRERVGQTLGL